MKNSLRFLILSFSAKARVKRSLVFKNSFQLDEHTKILDLGSESGSNIYSVLDGTSVNPENVYIADIDSELLQKGKEMFGFVPVKIDESGKLPFPNAFFDIVYCSSVIEHVTVPKKCVWFITSDKIFKDKAFARQKNFAREIERMGKQYFVQTPYKYFPIETHSWLPFVSFLPRKYLIMLLRLTNKFWIKKTTPDWYLLDNEQFSSLFCEAEIICEKAFGFTKSLMAITSKKIK